MGHGDLLDPDAFSARVLAAQREAIPGGLHPGILGHGVPFGDVHRMYGHAGEVPESGIPVAVAGSLRVRGAGGVDGGFLWYGHHKAGNAPEGGLPDGIAPMGRRRTRRWSSLFHKKRMLIRNFNM